MAGVDVVAVLTHRPVGIILAQLAREQLAQLVWLEAPGLKAGKGQLD
jgi:hypothetical protein